MTNLLIPNKITGLDTHLRVFPDGNTQTARQIETSDIVVGSKDWGTYLKSVCVEPPYLLPEPHRKAIQTILRLEEKNRIIPANLVLKKDEFESVLLSYIQQISEFLKSNPIDYFENYLKREMRFLDEMLPAFINEEKFASYSVEDQQGLVKTFTPDRYGYARVVKYDHFKSPTGRLVVTDGPHVLTIAKKYRNMVESSYEKGAILSVDYVSLEPTVLLARTPETLSNWLCSTQRTNNQKERDIYQAVVDILLEQKLLHSPITRDDCKAIVLRTLYGAQEDLIDQIVQGKNSVPLYDFLFEVRELFGINELLRKLQTERKKNGGIFITNHYGRRIPTEGVEDYKLVNYWTQSTAVDVALLGFSQIMEDLKLQKARSLFVIHDALYVDIHASALNILVNNIKQGKTVPLFPEGTFSLKVSIQK